LVAPQVAEIFERDPRPFFQAIFDCDSPQIVFGRVALLGDAAFVARPHPGAGTTKGAMDAAKLADSISTLGIEAGLARYQHEQRAFGSGMVALGRREGAYLTDQFKPRAERQQPAISWPIEDLIHSHNTRSDALRKVLDASRQIG